MSLSFDFDSIKNRLITSLRAAESWAKILFYSTNQRIIDAVADEMEKDMLYNEITTVETKWSLAKQLSSIMSQVQFFNYFPHRKVGSSGNVKISTSPTFNGTHALNVPVPKYSIVANLAGTIKFCVSKTITLPSSENYIYAEVIQGIPKNITFTANGDIYERFTVTNTSVENSVFDVYVNGILWTKVDFIREATTDSLNYTIENAKDFSTVDICFGNGNFGRKLSAGDTVVFYYVETLGTGGNISSTGVVTSIESVLYDTDGNAKQCYCTNDSSLIGGVDYEDIESIRVSAPRAYHAGDRAISKEDYQYIVETFTFIEKATVWGEAETNEDEGNLPGTYIPTEENVVHIACITTDGSQITSTQESSIRTLLNQKKAPVDIVVFSDVNFIYIHFNITAYVSDKRYTLSEVKGNIATTLQNTYSIENMEFKQAIRFSDYVAKIDGVTGVDYHNTTISLFAFGKFNSAYTTSIFLEMLDVTPSSVKVYAKYNSDPDYIQIAHDDGLGNFVAETGYTVSASTIAYTDGSIALIVTSGLIQSYANYTLKVTFSIDSTNIIPTKRYQMVTYGSSTVSTIYE